MYKTAHIRVSALFVFLLLLFACDKTKNNTDSTTKEAIAIDKMEAQLLVDVTQKNLNTIAFCAVVDTITKEPILQQTLDTVKLDQKEIFDQLQNVAQDNLISIASRPTRYIQGTTSEEINTDDSFTLLNLLIAQLKQQHTVLKKLKEKTDNQSIRAIATITNKKLKENIQLSLQTLERLE